MDALRKSKVMQRNILSYCLKCLKLQKFKISQRKLAMYCEHPSVICDPLSHVGGGGVQESVSAVPGSEAGHQSITGQTSKKPELRLNLDCGAAAPPHTNKRSILPA